MESHPSTPLSCRSTRALKRPRSFLNVAFNCASNDSGHEKRPASTVLVSLDQDCRLRRGCGRLRMHFTHRHKGGIYNLV
jgi:hypothetical protein